MRRGGARFGGRQRQDRGQQGKQKRDERTAHGSEFHRERQPRALRQAVADQAGEIGFIGDVLEVAGRPRGWPTFQS